MQLVPCDQGEVESDGSCCDVDIVDANMLPRLCELSMYTGTQPCNLRCERYRFKSAEVSFCGGEFVFQQHLISLIPKVDSE